MIFSGFFVLTTVFTSKVIAQETVALSTHGYSNLMYHDSTVTLKYLNGTSTSSYTQSSADKQTSVTWKPVTTASLCTCPIESSNTKTIYITSFTKSTPISTPVSTLSNSVSTVTVTVTFTAPAAECTYPSSETYSENKTQQVTSSTSYDGHLSSESIVSGISTSSEPDTYETITLTSTTHLYTTEFITKSGISSNQSSTTSDIDVTITLTLTDHRTTTVTVARTSNYNSFSTIDYGDNTVAPVTKTDSRSPLSTFAIGTMSSSTLSIDSSSSTTLSPSSPVSYPSSLGYSSTLTISMTSGIDDHSTGSAVLSTLSYSILMPTLSSQSDLGVSTMTEYAPTTSSTNSEVISGIDFSTLTTRSETKPLSIYPSSVSCSSKDKSVILNVPTLSRSSQTVSGTSKFSMQSILSSPTLTIPYGPKGTSTQIIYGIESSSTVNGPPFSIPYGPTTLATSTSITSSHVDTGKSSYKNIPNKLRP